jgi:hypothetical protein
MRYAHICELKHFDYEKGKCELDAAALDAATS